MKFVISSIDLNQAVQKMGRLLSAKTTIPILEGVLVKAQGDVLIFTASDGSESIIHRISMDKAEGNMILEEGTCVLAKETFTVVKKMKGFISFEVQNTSVTLKQDNTTLELTTLDAGEYPLIETPENKHPLVLSGAEFTEIINQTTFATSKMEIRPILMGVNMKFGKEHCSFTATDSHRLARFSMKGIESLTDDITITVPATILDQAIKSFDLNQDVILLPGERTIALANSNTILVAPLLEGNYPETERLIPTDFGLELVLNREELVQALELLCTLSGKNVVNMKISSLFADFYVTDAGAKGNRELAFESLEGENEEDFAIGFSSLYVLDVLKRIKAKSVRFQFTGVMKPFLIIPEEVQGDTDCIQLVLPVRQI